MAPAAAMINIAYRFVFVHGGQADAYIRLRQPSSGRSDYHCAKSRKVTLHTTLRPSCTEYPKV